MSMRSDESRSGTPVKPNFLRTQSLLKLEDFIPYRLSIASNSVSDVIGGAYRELFSISIPEWRLITVLAEGENLTPLELGSRTLMDKVTVSRAAIGLRKRKLVEKKPHPDDKRSHLLRLSKAGEALYAKVTPAVLALEERVLDGFSMKERNALKSMLSRLEAAALAMRE